MPIYEYQCRECSHRLEKLQKMSDAPLTRCPECGKEALTKLVSAAGFRLAGGGWYETDFKKDGKRNLAGGHPPQLAAGTARWHDFREISMRSHLCGRVDEALDGREVTLCGWVARSRDLGGLIFIGLRDHAGVVQVVVEPDNA